MIIQCVCERPQRRTDILVQCPIQEALGVLTPELVVHRDDLLSHTDYHGHKSYKSALRK